MLIDDDGLGDLGWAFAPGAPAPDRDALLAPTTLDARAPAAPRAAPAGLSTGVKVAAGLGAAGLVFFLVLRGRR